MRNNRGVVQSTLVMTVSVLTLLVLAAIIAVAVKKQIEQRDENRKNAQDAAEYGMMIALKKIEESPRWQEGFSNVKYRDCHYDVKIEKIGDNVFRAQATGNSHNVKKRIVCTYQLIAQDSVMKPKTVNWEYQ
jgi:hypothetical protein